MHPRRIIFVYGSNHRLFDLVIGWSRKAAVARDAAESLGDLHGLLTVWDRFIRLLPCAAEFVERSEAGELPHLECAQSPLVLIEHRDLVEVLVHSKDIHETDSVSGLMTLVEIRLEEWRARRLVQAQFLAGAPALRSTTVDAQPNDRPSDLPQPNRVELN